ncbi:NrfD/PsrC family molybdoenzyme membrane anchor subunit [Actinomadura sp. 7K534]|uniref:NrfD/PsrC family molybdoenzyme membrane anchor subunit n=1 Tax=Actinomadura sp. 7K534 TaxID=2530366 RepID=UPI00104DC9F5|nr:NrfD/PsrC family molybdoenzyme membrane anchor subunit [Actinomadura sp. 7K534]TDB85199.1 polysulfide reductase [Actinomadura sp. 7K534]
MSGDGTSEGATGEGGPGVSKEGLHGERPGREAEIGRGLARRNGRRGRRRGEQAMVPEAEFTSYYGLPILNPPTWKATDIAGYFFLGGLAGAGSVLAAGAQLTGRPAAARAMKISSLAAIGGSTALLIHDLGRPARFANMLRVMKPTSPMSMGSWLLGAYGPAAGAAAVLDATGLFPRLGAAATAGAAVLGPLVATYTAALAADTAVPSWHDVHRELPMVFAGSATSAAAGMGLVVSPAREAAPMRTAAVFGAVLELAAAKLIEHRAGLVAEPYKTGKAGRYMRAGEILTAAGTAGGVLLAGRGRTAAALSGAALLAGSACTRFGIFHAGVQSAEDPKYTVVPQRERLTAAANESGNGARNGSG